MPTIKTPLSQLLNLDVPIISAPMATATSPDLVAAVTAAGGFGLLGAGNFPSDVVKRDIRAVRTKLNISDDKPVPIGIGMVGCVLDTCGDQVLEDILEEKPLAVWLAFGKDLGKYVARIRDFDRKSDRQTIVFVIVNSLEEAKKAAYDWKVDVLVVQGIEAGGHCHSKAPPLFDLVPDILKEFPKGGPLVVAAGGVSTGRQVAALLTLGVHGVVLGTRFLFSPECVYTRQQKEELVKAHLKSTTRSVAFDEVRGLEFWPEGYDGRAIENDIITDAKAGLDKETRCEKVRKADGTGDIKRSIIWAGIGAGLVDKIKPASEIVKELREDAVAALKAVSTLI